MLGRGFRIGRLFGIDIIIDWSWMFILILIVWNLTNIFGQVHPGWSTNIRVGMALVAALLFFGSVLAHELAHALVALSQNLPVSNITLFLFGGAAYIQREPTRPRNEFFMAIAGPVASLLIGVVLLGIALLSLFFDGIEPGYRALLSHMTPARTLLTWLGFMNIILAAFNMIPGFPLDGGRVLRSFLWGITQNLRRATRWAASMGHGIAITMMIAGIAMMLGVNLPLLGTGLISGAWLTFIGWFLNSASAQSYQQAVIQDALEGVPVARLMHTNSPTIEPDCTVQHLANLQDPRSDNQAIPVLQEERLVGIVTLNDARHIPKSEWDWHLVDEIMTPETNLVTTNPTEDAAQALEKLIERGVHQLPVVRELPGFNGSEFLGMLRRADIAQWLQLQTENGRRLV